MNDIYIKLPVDIFGDLILMRIRDMGYDAGLKFIKKIVPEEYAVDESGDFTRPWANKTDFIKFKYEEFYFITISDNSSLAIGYEYPDNYREDGYWNIRIIETK